MIVDSETYCIGLIVEECAEAQQLLGKALRFGIDAPGCQEAPYHGQSARENLPKELGDVLAAIDFACLHGLFDLATIEKYRDKKIAKLLDTEQKDANGFPLAPPVNTQQYFNSDGSISDWGGHYYR